MVNVTKSTKSTCSLSLSKELVGKAIYQLLIEPKYALLVERYITAKNLELIQPKLGCFSCSLTYPAALHDPPRDLCHLKVPLFIQ